MSGCTSKVKFGYTTLWRFKTHCKVPLHNTWRPTPRCIRVYSIESLQGTLHIFCNALWLTQRRKSHPSHLTCSVLIVNCEQVQGRTGGYEGPESLQLEVGEDLHWHSNLHQTNQSSLNQSLSTVGMTRVILHHAHTFEHLAAPQAQSDRRPL